MNRFKLNGVALIGGAGIVFLTSDLMRMLASRAWVDALINAELIALMLYYILIYPLKPLGMNRVLSGFILVHFMIVGTEALFEGNVLNGVAAAVVLGFVIGYLMYDHHHKYRLKLTMKPKQRQG